MLLPRELRQGGGREGTSRRDPKRRTLPVNLRAYWKKRWAGPPLFSKGVSSPLYSCFHITIIFILSSNPSCEKWGA
ncbi:hypothetical protein OJAV_G00079210 [Oryzias javanicus]|uniref:Uncharacterized protein n=1 Tax=Oryzias javanicus TaxID=123683 RepID=A0A3S2PTR3_ORYJA|nr:hypothetical protein OJAV_G00079210 [Oryzias javanicus]